MIEMIEMIEDWTYVHWITRNGIIIMIIQSLELLNDVPTGGGCLSALFDSLPAASECAGIPGGEHCQLDPVGICSSLLRSYSGGELCRRSAAAGSCEWRAMAAMDVDGGIGGGLSKPWMSDLSKPKCQVDRLVRSRMDLGGK